MKESIAYHQQTNVMQHQSCSEEKCITCFENRGCIYEQYLITVTHNVVESFLAKQNEDHNSAKNQFLVL